MNSLPSRYIDYRIGLDELKTHPTVRRSSITPFHLYTEFRNPKEIESLRSFFATQNLDTTQLYLWSDYDISSDPRLKPFADRIIFKVYDPKIEVKDTILENHNSCLLRDERYYLQSDLLRLLCCSKYGGVWFDMDIILLRDFSYLLDEEFMYQWGGDDYRTDGCCASVMCLSANSQLSHTLLGEIKTQPAVGCSTTWGKDLFAKVWKKCPFQVHPSSYFNIEWLISKVDEPLSRKILDYWFDEPCPDRLLFTDCYSWHWHNSSYKNRSVVPESKFDKLSRRNTELLLHRGFSVL